MYCAKCGHEIKQQDKYCPGCGAFNSNYAPEQTYEPEERNENRRDKKRIAILIIIGLAILLLIAEVFFYFRNRDRADDVDEGEKEQQEIKLDDDDWEQTPSVKSKDWKESVDPVEETDQYRIESVTRSTTVKTKKREDISVQLIYDRVVIKPGVSAYADRINERINEDMNDFFSKALEAFEDKYYDELYEKDHLSDDDELFWLNEIVVSDNIYLSDHLLSINLYSCSFSTPLNFDLNTGEEIKNIQQLFGIDDEEALRWVENAKESYYENSGKTALEDDATLTKQFYVSALTQNYGEVFMVFYDTPDGLQRAYRGIGLGTVS